MKKILTMSLITALAALFGCGKQKHKATEIQIDTPEGQVTAYSTQVDDFPQKVTPLSAEELRQFEAWAGQMSEFVDAYHAKIDKPTLKDCDQAFRAWLNSTHRSHTEQQTIEILGSYLGQWCVQDLPMEWVKVSDQYGEDYAVRHVKSEAMGFPFSSVMKRIEDKQYDFMHGVFYAIKNTIEGGDLMERESKANQ